MKLYIDTNVIIDAIKNRNNLFGKNLGNASAKIFFDACTCRYYLIISTWTLQELYRFVNFEDAEMLLKLLKKKTISATPTNEEKQQAADSSNYDDKLHIILAERENADYIITRDVEHFRGTRIQVKKPEYLF